MQMQSGWPIAAAERGAERFAFFGSGREYDQTQLARTDERREGRHVATSLDQLFAFPRDVIRSGAAVHPEQFQVLLIRLLSWTAVNVAATDVRHPVVTVLKFRVRQPHANATTAHGIPQGREFHGQCLRPERSSAMPRHTQQPRAGHPQREIDSPVRQAKLAQMIRPTQSLGHLRHGVEPTERNEQSSQDIWCRHAITGHMLQDLMIPSR